MERLRRDKMFGWVCPDNAMYVGRPSIWGNPFKVGSYYRDTAMLDAIGFTYRDSKNYNIKFNRLFVADIELCLTLYKLWLDYVLKKYPEKYNLQELLKYKYLICYCKLTDSCHADVLMTIIRKTPFFRMGI